MDHHRVDWLLVRSDLLDGLTCLDQDLVHLILGVLDKVVDVHLEGLVRGLAVNLVDVISRLGCVATCRLWVLAVVFDAR